MKLLETSYLVDYETGRESARAYFDEHADEPLAVSTISAFELAFGVAWDSRRDPAEVRETLTWVEFVEFSAEDALESGRVHAELQAAGEQIPIPDVMIAGVSRNRGATLVAADAHYDAIDGLDVERYRSG